MFPFTVLPTLFEKNREIDLHLIKIFVKLKIFNVPHDFTEKSSNNFSSNQYEYQSGYRRIRPFFYVIKPQKPSFLRLRPTLRLRTLFHEFFTEMK